jgi:hypothetical protein
MSDSITYAYKELNTALYAFLERYITPSVNSDCIFLGSQENMVLPEGEDYVIYQVIQQIRHGTTTEKYNPDNELLELKELNEIIVKVDCYADSTNSTDNDALLRAQIRANNLNLLFRSSVACSFFKSYGISALYAEDATDTTLISDSNQYLHRWSVNIHLSMPNTVTVVQEGFTSMKIKPNSLVTQAEADTNPDTWGKLHYSDIDVKIPVNN